MHFAKLGLAVALGWMVSGSVLGMDVPVEASPTVQLTPRGEFLQQVREATRLFERGDMVAANKAFKSVAADKRLAALPGDQRQNVLLLAGSAAFQAEETDRARDLLERSLRIGPASYASYLLSVLTLIGDEPDLAARHLAEGIRQAPDELDGFHEDLVPEVLRASTQGSAERLELMQALFDSGWDRNGLGASNVWFELVEARLQQGQIEQAKAAAGRIDGAMSLARLRVDKRFDALITAMPDLPTPEAAAKARAERLRTLVSEQPKRLEALHSLIGALLMLGEWEEALRLTDDASARIKAAPADDPAFEDDGKLSWLKDRRSRVLRSLGRTDEALAEMKSAADTLEMGKPNVSQVLNLGHFYCQLGRPDDALAAITRVGEDISGYGLLVEGTVQLWAATLKRDERGARRALRKLREHRADGEDAYLDALVVAGRLDEAAAELITQLGDEKLRASALMAMQEFLEPAALPGEVDYQRSRRELLAREDVRAAIQKVGRIERFAIYAGWDDE